MAIGERIRFFRNLKGMTQKYLGMQVGFPEKTADIRMAQYESGSRTPKADLTNNLANVFGISTSALTVPDIDSYNGLMHTLLLLRIYTVSVLVNLMMSFAYALIKVWEQIILQCLICFPLGRNKQKNLKTAKSQKKNMIIGDITTPKA